MDRSLLFESSYIFDDSNLVDRIRQSLIDLEVDPPSEEEVQDLLKEAITYIDKDLPISTAVDLFSLISSCFSHYPNQLLPIFVELFKTATSNANHIIVTSSVLSVLTHVQPPLSLPDYHAFVDDSLNQILPQIQKSDEVNIKVFNHEIPAQCTPNLIINLLSSATLTKQLLTDYAPIVFSQKIVQTNSKLNLLVKDISKSGLITSLPESVLMNDFFFSKLLPDDLASIIPDLSENVFKNIFPRLEEMVIKSKNQNQRFAISFLQKCCDLNMTIGPIAKVLESLSASDLTPQIWEFLKKYDFTLPEKIANEVKEFPDPVFAFKIMPNRQNLPQDVLTRALLETTNIHTYEVAFRSGNIVCPVLSTPEFWLHILSICSSTIDRSDRFMILFVRYFQDCVQQDKVNEILDQMIFAHSPPQAKDCIFVFSLVYRLSGEYKQIFRNPDHIKSILLRVAETKMMPSIHFWKLIFQIDPLYQILQTNPDPILLFGYAFISRQMNHALVLNSVEILEQNDASNHDLFDFIARPQRDIDLDVKSDMKLPAISLISSAFLFTIAQAFKRSRNPNQQQQQFNVKGLTKETILPFLAVICKYSNTFERRNEILLETFNFIKAQETFSILIEACKYLENNNSPILTTSVDHFLPTLLELCIPQLYPLIMDILNVFIPFLLRGEYTADKKKLMSSIARFSSSPLSGLRGQFGNRDFRPSNQQTTEEVNQFFGTYGVNLLEYYLKHLPDIKGNDPINRFQFNLKVFDVAQVATIITKTIQESTSHQEIIDIVHFVDRDCLNVPILTFENSENITKALHESIKEEKWNDVMLLSQFMKKHNLKKELLTFLNEPIQHNIKVNLMSDIPIDQLSLEDLVSILISDPQPQTDRLLYNIMFKKLTQDESIIMDYITTLFEKINDRIAFTDTLLLTLYSKEYQQFGDNFIKALNRSYVKPPGTDTFILRPEFKFTTKPASDVAQSLISKLYASAAEKPGNFQSFVWLRSLAYSFPFLFTENTQQIFDSILGPINDLSLVFTLPEMSEKLSKLAPRHEQNINNNDDDIDNENNNEEEEDNGNDNENNENDNNNENNNDNANNNNNDNANDNANGNEEQSEEKKEQLKKEREQQLKEIEEVENKVKASFAALEFLISTLYSPKVLDDFAVWLFDNISTLSDSQTFALILVLRSLYSMRTVQLVLTSFMIKSTFPEIVTNLIEREIPEGIFRDNFLNSIYTLTATYYSSLKSLTPEIVAAVDVLQQIENPFQVTFDHCISILPNLQRVHPSVLITFPPDNSQSIRGSSRRMGSTSHYSQVINFIDMIENNTFSNDKDPRHEPNANLIRTFRDHLARLTPPPEPYTGPLPSSINREAFQLLPMKLQSTTLYWSLPKIPSPLTPKMIRYLATQPTWAAMWIKKTYALLILPEHYGILYNIISDLVKIQQNGTAVEGGEVEEDVNPEDLTLIQYCQGTLFEDLIKQAANSSRSDRFFVPLCSLFNEISQNGTALISLLEYISQQLTTINSEENIEKNPGKSLKSTKRLVHVLKEISKNEGFKENFNDICGNTLLDIACSLENRSHPTLLIQVSELFSILGDDMPNKITQLIGFMFLLKKPHIIPAALNLCSKLSEQKLENIMSLVQKSFDRAINPDKPSPNDIIEFLKRFPAVANTRQQQLTQLLYQLLDKYEKSNPEAQGGRVPRETPHSKQSLELIGAIFNVLAPRRNTSLSIKMSDSVTVEPASSSSITLQKQKSTSNTIPPYINDLAPEFWSVFQKYKKLIMQIIENNPIRLKTIFKFLIDYPELTDFKIRSAYFYMQMKKKISNSQLDFKVRRSNILADSFARLHNAKTEELLRKFHISFIGEPGVDLGGVTRDWFTTLVKEIFNPNYALFIPSANERSVQPNPLSYINRDHINYFRFAGQIIARALIEGLNLDAHLTTSFSKHILHHSLNLRDLEDVDEELYRSLEWMRNNDVSDLDMYFVADADDLGVHQTINLKPNGINIKVTNENKEEFVNLMVEHRLKGSITNQVKAFCEGFNSLIPYEDIKRFTPNELDLLICGIPEIDVEDLKKYTDIQAPYTAESPVIKYFFDAISKWTNENLAKLILFMTGSSQVPLNGFKSFKDVNKPITIAPGGGRERLPAAHTCFNRLDLPEYDSEEELNQKLMFAIQECNSFGFV